MGFQTALIQRPVYITTVSAASLNQNCFLRICGTGWILTVPLNCHQDTERHCHICSVGRDIDFFCQLQHESWNSSHLNLSKRRARDRLAL